MRLFVRRWTPISTFTIFPSALGCYITPIQYRILHTVYQYLCSSQANVQIRVLLIWIRIQNFFLWIQTVILYLSNYPCYLSNSHTSDLPHPLPDLPDICPTTSDTSVADQDVYTRSRIRIFPSRIPNPGSKGSRIRIHIQEFMYFWPKQSFLNSRKYDQGHSSRIRIFFSILDTGSGSATLPETVKFPRISVQLPW